MLQSHKFFLGLAACLTLASAARADTPQSAVASPAGEPTRIELVVAGQPSTQEAEDLAKRSNDHVNFALKANEAALAQATKIEADFAAQWPKCHFYIASITAPGATPPISCPEAIAISPSIPAELKNSLNQASLRVTILGEPRCLAAK